MTKLSKISLSLGTVFIGAVLVGSYITGKQAENAYMQALYKINHYFAQKGIQAKIKDVAFKRHFFYSDIEYQIEFEEAKNLNLSAQTTLFHGPFPFNRLKQAKLLPVMASTETIFETPVALQTYFNDKHFLYLQSDIDYKQQLESKLKFSPFQMDSATYLLQLSETKAELSGNHFALTIPNVRTTDKVTGVQYDYENTYHRLDFVQESPYPYLRNGYYSANIAAYKLAIPSYNVGLHIKNSNVSGNLRIEQARFILDQSHQAELHIANEKQHSSLGNLHSYASIDVDAEMLNELLSALITQDEEKLQIALHTLLHRSPRFNLDKLEWKHPKGKSELQLLLNVGEIKNENWLEFMHSSGLDFKLNRLAIEEVLTQINRFNPQMKGVEEKQAQFMLNSIKNRLDQVGIIQADDQLISISLNIRNGKMFLNNNELSGTEMQGLVLLLLFGLGG